MEVSCLHLGILPHKNINAVVDIVNKYFTDVPFWALLPNYSPVEGRFFQTIAGFPGLKTDLLKKRYYIDTGSYIYQSRVPEIVKDFKDLSLKRLAKYRPNSVFFDYFLRIVEEKKPKYAKGQITGAITLGLLLTDGNGIPIIENRTAMDVLVKTICLQIISQICEMKNIYPAVTPYIFVNDSEINTAYIPENAYRSRKHIVSILKAQADTIKENGGIPVFHSSSCIDWSVPIDAGFDVLSFNADKQFVTLLSQNLKLDKFLNAGGKLAWGIIPGNIENIKNTDAHILFDKFMGAVIRLKDFYKLHKSLILNNSIITVGGNVPELTDIISEKSIVLARLLADKLEQEAAKPLDND